MHTPSDNNSGKSIKKDPNLTRKRLFRFIGLLGLLLLLYIFSDKIINLYNRYFVNEDKLLVTYLDKTDLYNDDSDAIVKNVKLKLFRLSAEEYSVEIKNTQDQLQELTKTTKNLKTPKGFSNHKKSFMAVMKERMLVLSYLDKARKDNSFDELNAHFDELAHKQELERSSLKKAFDDAGIEYKELGDGSFRYWYKSHSAKPIR
ncbi:hypothetical protein [Bacillus sp. 1NLA3E]|uniref:hypothetical protein n=1 Tax=Bacillus sp. 1NLA3E TaxID=666686 RepID=UPI000247EA9E|nr:hypothetical protein [Bacillus sp. 1NLA3E]AGK55793.1 hypothetical protein B1NLA3E_20265 [Bacillus sp. 1NLA3E]